MTESGPTRRPVKFLTSALKFFSSALKLLTSALMAGAFTVLGLSAQAHAYVLLGAAWNVDKGPVEFRLQPAGSEDLTDGSDLEAVRAAFRTWSCIEDSALRFVESTEAGVREVGLDGTNNVFWDENNTYMLGPSTLGVSFNNPQGGTNVDGDIVFNGFDHTWSTDSNISETDVQSIAIHEIGHLLGLGHPCTDMTESDCLSAEESVMTPVWNNGDSRTPLDDDKDGLLDMYEQDEDDNSTCDGPYRVGEVCSCDDDCANGLICSEQMDGSQVCARTCDSDNPDGCGAGFNCVLTEKPDEGPGIGKCFQTQPGQAKPAGSTCSNDGFSCGQNSCENSGAAGARVCFQSCIEDEDCGDGYVCSGILCLLAADEVGISCAEPATDGGPDGGDGNETPGCGCKQHSGAEGPVGFALLGVLLARRRRRARR